MCVDQGLTVGIQGAEDPTGISAQSEGLVKAMPVLERDDVAGFRRIERMRIAPAHSVGVVGVGVVSNRHMMILRNAAKVLAEAG